MGRWILLCLILCAATVGLVGWLSGAWNSDGTSGMVSGEPQTSGSASPGSGPQTKVMAANLAAGQGRFLTIPEGRLLVVNKQEVGAEAEGTLAFIATSAPAGSEVGGKIFEGNLFRLGIRVGDETAGAELTPDSSGQLVRYLPWRENLPMPPGKMLVARKTEKFRKLGIGDTVKQGDLVGLINPTTARDDLKMAAIQLEVRDHDKHASIKLFEEYTKKWQNHELTNRRTPGAVAKEEIDQFRIGADAKLAESKMKTAEVERSGSELSAAATKLGLHEIRALIGGTIKMIYKNPGDTVRKYDPVVQIMDMKRLRVESLIGQELTPYLQLGTTVLVETSRPQTPLNVMPGHLQAITAVAVSQSGGRPVIVSASEDRTVRGWDVQTGRQTWEVGPFSTTVRALATGPARSSLVLIGVADGSSWVFDMNNPKDPPLEMKERHKGAVNTVAFSPDGISCATAGEDRSIVVWDVGTRKKGPEYNNAHRGAITSLAYASATELVSRGRDNAIHVWAVSGANPLKRIQDFDRRTGEVSASNTDGKRILFEQGKELRILSLADKTIQGVLLTSSGTSSFSNLALFAPDGKTILTSGTENKLQLWRTPAHEGRGAESRQFLWTSASTCGAFAPDSSFAVTGTQDGKLLLWPMPSQDEINKQITAKLVLIEQALDSSTMQVRVWAELTSEAEQWLVPGSSATIVVPLANPAGRTAGAAPR